MDLEPTISNLKDLFNEIFYDWGCTPTSPQLHKDGSSYWINKTDLSLKDQEIILSYKMQSWLVTPMVYEAFSKFYELYEGDLEFEAVLGEISQVWHNNTNIKKTKDGFSIKEFAVGKQNNQPYIFTKSTSYPISQSTYVKLLKLYHWWSTI
jgi:hypothetical protein